MLKELQVKNFAIIDDVKIKFGKGLNILTGETGAGKTLIIEAINLLIGERADVDLIRDGSDDLLVQGYFDFRDNPAVLDYLLYHKTHIEILDRFGSERISSVKKEYSIKLEEYLKSKEDFLRLKELKDIREDKLKDSNYRYEEIKNLNIKENEEEILENEVRILKNYEKIYKLASEGEKILEGEDANNK